jgi:hypothetical protein
MRIHEDDSIPRGEARVSLDFSEVWCHPDDAEAIRQHHRTADEVREAVAEALAAEVAEEPWSDSGSPPELQ